MISFLAQFVPLLVFSLIIIHFVFRGRKGVVGGFNVKKTLIFVFALLVYRSSIIAMFMVGPAAFSIFISAVALWAIYRKKVWKERAAKFAGNFILLFPIYMFFAVLAFSSKVCDRCDLLAKEKAVKPVLSLCDKNSRLTAGRHTKNMYHCRCAFYSADRSLVYVGFGAETNQNVQALLGVDPTDHGVKRTIRSKTVFRGYCDPKYGDCVFLIAPGETIRIWDDDKQSIIRDYRSPKDRPRFLSLDPVSKKVYAISDSDWIAVVDLAARRIEKKFMMNVGSLLTVANTRKRVVATMNMFWPVLLMADKESGKVEHLHIGLLRVWKSLGFFFHVTADPVRERAFAAAPFECAVYMVDLNRKKTLWRHELPIGIRDVAYDTKRNMLYAANYVNGYVYKFDASGDRPRYTGRFFIGRRIRFFNYEPDKDVFLAACANGFLIYDPKLDEKGRGN